MFRGYCPEDDKWYFGDLEYARKRNVAKIHTYTEEGDYDKQHVVSPSSVGRFTGMVNFCGNGIYEGDIVKIHFGLGEIVGSVEYDNHNGCYVFVNETNRFSFNGIKPCNIEIVGNSYKK